MERTDDQNAAIVAWAESVAAFAKAVEGMGEMFAGEVARIDGELAEIRDDVLALANRIQSVHSSALRALTHQVSS